MPATFPASRTARSSSIAFAPMNNGRTRPGASAPGPTLALLGNLGLSGHVRWLLYDLATRGLN
jgi:hypothetical protein